MCRYQCTKGGYVQSFRTNHLKAVRSPDRPVTPSPFHFGFAINDCCDLGMRS